MRYMVMHYSDEAHEADVPRSPELIAGFAILDMKSKAEAIEHAKHFAARAGVSRA
ncbi:MAG: hypothetical protein AB7Q42_20150 [Acidimicrobiia bacterium]